MSKRQTTSGAMASASPLKTSTDSSGGSADQRRCASQYTTAALPNVRMRLKTLKSVWYVYGEGPPISRGRTMCSSASGGYSTGKSR